MVRIDQAIELATRYGVTLCSYGICYGCRAHEKPVHFKARAQGAMCEWCTVLRMRSPLLGRSGRKRGVLQSGLKPLRPHGRRHLKQAARMQLTNFDILQPSSDALGHYRHIGFAGNSRLWHLWRWMALGPAHVSTVIGSQPYRYFAEEFQSPVVIAGFEPLDVLQAICMLIKQVNEGRAEVKMNLPALSERVPESQSPRSRSV